MELFNLRGRIGIFFLLLLFLARPGFSRAGCESPGEVCKVCFLTYEKFVQSHPEITSAGLRLEGYIPDDLNQACFFARRVSPQESIVDPSWWAAPFELDEIYPALFSGQSYDRCFPGTTFSGVRPDEWMVRFDSPEDALRVIEILQGYQSLQGTAGRRPEAGLSLQFGGPLGEAASTTDQVKIIGDLNEFFELFVGERVGSAPVQGNFDAQIHLLPSALWHSIVRIDPFQYATLRNGMTAGVIQSGDRFDQSIVRKGGLMGDDEVVGILDDSLDINHCFFKDQYGNPPGPRHRKLRNYRASEGPTGMHGTFVAGIIAGLSSDPLEVNNGQAPKAYISFDSVWDIAAKGPITSTLYQALQEQYDDGARIFSNSWGDSERGWYTGWAYDIDRFTWEREDALVIFAVHNDGKVMSPENAKNVLAVGASKKANLKDHHGRAGKGPTCGQQRKPEIFAPGCRIRSALVDQRLGHEMNHGTSCGVGQMNVRYPGEGLVDKIQSTPLHSSSCATSWAAPAVAGAAALAREHLRDRKPSGALVKAILLNATRDLVGRYETSEYPNDIEGWGWLVLDDALFFEGDERKVFMYDVWKDKGLGLNSPPSRFRIRTNESAEPLKITLVWTDPPPAPMVRSNPAVNNLDLHVRRIDCAENERCFFLGNYFAKEGISQGYQRQPEKGDEVNNVEQVLIKKSGGEYCISVAGVEIHTPKQGYALVATGSIVSMEPSAEDCSAISSAPRYVSAHPNGSRWRLDETAEIFAEPFQYLVSSYRARLFGGLLQGATPTPAATPPSTE